MRARLTSQQKEQVYELADRDWSGQRIADAIGISRNQVYTALERRANPQSKKKSARFDLCPRCGELLPCIQCALELRMERAGKKNIDYSTKMVNDYLQPDLDKKSAARYVSIRDFHLSFGKQPFILPEEDDGDE